jgi:hypothetical protein
MTKAKADEQKGKDVLDIQAQIRAELDVIKTTVAPPSGFVISTKGRVFGLPDGSVDEGPMYCVIADYVSMNMYYTGAYNANAVQPPACWALGKDLVNLGPSANVPSPQSTLCSDCPKNEWGSAAGGGKGKACKNTRRLMVVGAALLETNLAEAQPYILSVSPTGLKHFDKYVTSLSDQGIHPAQVVTEISFDPNSAFPSLRFKLDKKLTDGLVTAVWVAKDNNQSILLQEPQIEKAA